MHFELNKTLHTISTGIVTALAVACAALAILASNPGVRAGAIFSFFVALCFLIFFYLPDYSAYVEFDPSGLRISRRGKRTELRWNDVRRIELTRFKAVPLLNYLTLHTSTQKIVLEYKFQDRETMWAEIIRCYKANAAEPLVDADVPYQ